MCQIWRNNVKKETDLQTAIVSVHFFDWVMKRWTERGAMTSGLVLLQRAECARAPKREIRALRFRFVPGRGQTDWFGCGQALVAPNQGAVGKHSLEKPRARAGRAGCCSLHSAKGSTTKPSTCGSREHQLGAEDSAALPLILPVPLGVWMCSITWHKWGQKSEGWNLETLSLKNLDARFSFLLVITFPLTPAAAGSVFLFGATASYRRNIL